MASRPLTLAGATAIGFGAAWFFDPNSGAQRRNELRDKFASRARTGAGSVAGAARDIGAKAGGAVASKTSGTTEPANDQALADKVKTEVLGDPEVPKDRINIDVSDGIVALRGEVDSRELMQALDDKARNVEGVRDVQNLLHLPGTPPPNLEPVAGA